jgi:large subunit ribosomal protein L23
MDSQYNVLVRPVISERSFDQMEQGKYTFEVAPKIPKEEIKDAVQKLFNVHVVKVNTLWVKPKTKRVRYQPGQTRTWKKAIVTLKEGETIELFSNQQKQDDDSASE